MIRNKKGVIFLQVLIIGTLMLFIAVSASNMLLQDAHMVKHLKRSQQAQFLAEAGISHALATIANNGGMSGLAAGSFVNGNLASGNYAVTVVTSGSRWLLSAKGTAQGVERTVSMEIQDTSPTALNYILAAQNLLAIRAGFLTWLDINGQVHANNRVELSTGFLLGLLDISETATYTQDTVNLDVNGWITQIRVNGVNYNPQLDQDMDEWSHQTITFPSFDFEYYKRLALGDDGVDDASDDYYSGNITFGAWNSTTNLQPANGVIYVDGDVTFEGNCHLYGGIVANNITIPVKARWFSVTDARLYQHNSGHNRNFIISKNNINLSGRLYVTDSDNPLGALICAQNDFKSLRAGTRVDVNGCILAGHDINFRDFIAYITYDYVSVSPDMGESADSLNFRIVSWNR